MIKDMDLGGWYESDSLSENLRTVIPRVILVQESEPNSSDSEYNYIKNIKSQYNFLYNVICSNKNANNVQKRKYI